MNEEKCMCYITYAVPQSMVPQFFKMIPENKPKELYPEGFNPDWYLKSSFPEDDID